MSVAVLGFRVIGGDSTDVPLAEGLSEELTSRLGQIARLFVASRSVVRRLPNVERMPVDAIGSSLNVVYLVQGSLQRSANRLRIRAELVRASSGAVVWSEQYDRTDNDMLQLQDAVGTSVAQAVAGQLRPAERAALTTRPTRDAEAFRSYLRGRGMYLRQLTLENYTNTIREFEDAVSRDSLFAAPWAWLAIVHSAIYWSQYDRTEARLLQAQRAVDRARALAPNAGLTRMALGVLAYWGHRDYTAALRELTAARATDPNEPQVHGFIASIARRQGDFDLSVASRTRAIELDPSNAGEIGERAITLRVMRRYSEAERDLALSQRLNPALANAPGYRLQLSIMRDGSPSPALFNELAPVAIETTRILWGTSTSQVVWRLEGPHQDALFNGKPAADPNSRIPFYLAAAFAFSARGNVESARAAFDSVARIAGQRLGQLPDDDLTLATIAQAYAGLGRCDDALTAARRAAELLPISRDAFVGPLRQEVLAEVEAACGRPDAAIDRLTTLLDIPSNITRPRLRVDPAFERLRSNPRFERLLVAR